MELSSRSVTASVYSLFFSLFLTACGGGSGGSPSGNGDGGAVIPPDTRASGQAILGPVIDAEVELYALSDITTPLCATTTVISDDLELAGSIELPDACSSLDEDSLYLLTVSGGRDIDADDDGILDAAPTTVNGVIRAVISGAQVNRGNWRATALSEAVYQAVQYSLVNGDYESITEELKRIAPLYLLDDLTGDGVIDEQDLIAWHPRRNAGSVVNVGQILAVIDDIHAGLNLPVANQVSDLEGVSLFDLGSAVSEFLVEGNTAYIATRSALVIADISDPENLVIRSSIASAFIEDIDVKDGVVALALGEAGLQLVDASNPANPIAAGFLLGTYHHTTWYENGLIGLSPSFSIANSSTISAINVDNIAAPSISGSLLVDGVSVGSSYGYNPKIQTKGNVAYLPLVSISSLSAAIFIIDFTNPADPVLLNKVETDDQFTVIVDFILSENQLFFLTEEVLSSEVPATLTAYDISAPVSPVKLGGISSEALSSAYAIELFDEGVYALMPGSLQAYALPTFEQLFTLELPDIAAYDFTVLGQNAYIRALNSVISMPLQAIVPTVAIEGFAMLGRVVDARVEVHSSSDLDGAPLCTVRTELTVDMTEAGKITLPLSCVSKPGFYRISVIGGFDIDTDNDGVYDGGSTLVSGTMRGFFSSFELGQQWSVNPLTEVVYQLVAPMIGEVGLDVALAQAKLLSELMLVSDLSGDGGLDHIDFSSWNPVLDGASALSLEDADVWLSAVGQAITNDSPMDTLLSDVTPNYRVQAFGEDYSFWSNSVFAAVSTASKVSLIGDTSTERITLLGSIPVVGVKDIVGSGDIMYVARGDQGLLVVDIRDRLSPVVLNDFAEPLERVRVMGNYLVGLARKPWEGDPDSGVSGPGLVELVLIDMTNPASPVVLNRLTLEDSSPVKTGSEPIDPGLELHGGYAYISLWDHSAFPPHMEVAIVDLELPLAISLVNRLADGVFGQMINGMEFSVDTLYTVNENYFSGDAVIYTTDISDPVTAAYGPDLSVAPTSRSELVVQDLLYLSSFGQVTAYSLSGLVQQWQLDLPPRFSAGSDMSIYGDHLYLNYKQGLIRLPLP